MVGATLGVGNAIMIESSLSFLGLGVQPPTPTWGNMLMDAQATMASKPWLTIFPGLAILSWSWPSTSSATGSTTRSTRGSGRW